MVQPPAKQPGRDPGPRDHEAALSEALEDLDNQVLSDPASGFLSPNSHSYASVSP